MATGAKEREVCVGHPTIRFDTRTLSGIVHIPITEPAHKLRHVPFRPISNFQVDFGPDQITGTPEIKTVKDMLKLQHVVSILYEKFESSAPVEFFPKQLEYLRLHPMLDGRFHRLTVTCTPEAWNLPHLNTRPEDILQQQATEEEKRKKQRAAEEEKERKQKLLRLNIVVDGRRFARYVIALMLWALLQLPQFLYIPHPTSPEDCNPRLRYAGLLLALNFAATMVLMVIMLGDLTYCFVVAHHKANTEADNAIHPTPVPVFIEKKEVPIPPLPFAPKEEQAAAAAVKQQSPLKTLSLEMFAQWVLNYNS